MSPRYYGNTLLAAVYFMLITLNTILGKGKYKGKTILQIAPKILVGGWDYVAWIINNWNDDFDKNVIARHGWDAHCQKTGFGSNIGITNEDCWDNLS